MKTYITMSFAGMIIGYVLDLIFGDPDFSWHPIRLIGRLIAILERCLYPGVDAECIKDDRIEKKGHPLTHDVQKNMASAKRRRGTVLVICTLAVVAVVVLSINVLTYMIHPAFFLLAESVLVWLGLAQKSLACESMKVYDAFVQNDTERARHAVSMIVGRDTDRLDEEGIMRAAIETVAENTSDGIVAPLIYLALFGTVGEYAYKAVNTMDSMIGYKNEKYVDFGRCAAKLDDVANLVPSRLAAVLMIAAAFVLNMDYRNAAKIFVRDRYKHASPNSAQTESACAGALGLRLAGDAWYGGVCFKKEYIGDEIKHIEHADIKRACRLMHVTCTEAFLAALIIKTLIAIAANLIFLMKLIS